MPAATASHLEVVIGIILFWLAIGVLAVLRPNHPGVITRVLYLLGSIAGDHAGHTHRDKGEKIDRINRIYRIGTKDKNTISVLVLVLILLIL